MNLWFDLANTPHVLFFYPIIKELESNGHYITLTLRKFAQTVEVSQSFGLNGVVVGKHGGGSGIKKLINLIERTNQLKKTVKNSSIKTAISHNSYTQIMAGKLLGAKVITLMDYEGQPANHLAFRLADKIIVPKSFPASALKKFGAREKKIYRYDGFKEQVYLSDFSPDKNFITALKEKCDLDDNWKIQNKILVLIRTPATMAAYHRFENPLFDRLMKILNANSDLTVIAFPRINHQKKFIQNNYRNIIVPKVSLDSKNLIHYADLVISAGGTMNRESAILGTPAYSIFAGSIPQVDKCLIEMGRMSHISCESDLYKIKYEKKKKNQSLSNPNLKKTIINELLYI